MTIVCGTDLSTNAREAARAAAAIAKRLSEPLRLVHVIDELGAELTVSSGQGGIYDELRRRVREQAADLGAQFNIEVEALVVAGLAPDELLEVARGAGARLLVVSSLGSKRQGRWLLGSTAERLAQASPIPVLVVRDASSIEAWTQGRRTLRVMVGVEPTPVAKTALRWAAGLREIGRCDLLVTQVAWPFGEHLRLGVPMPIPLDHWRPEVFEPLARDLREWAGDLGGASAGAGAGETTFTVSPGWGRVDTHLTLLAAESKVDLLIVGAHQRSAAARYWQGSVSRGVLHQASTNVACVPRDRATQPERDIASFRRVLIPTDFSDLANRAIPVGYGLLGSGGVVHLLHVLSPKASEDDCLERLRALVPPGALARGIATEVELARDEDPGVGIWHAAGRLGVDAICMATHARSGLSRAVLGSQAQEVVQRAWQPVVLVPAGRVD